VLIGVREEVAEGGGATDTASPPVEEARAAKAVPGERELQ